MKKEKKLIIVIILIIVAIVTAILVIWFLNNRNKQYATTTVEDREVWNERLNDNPYLSEFDKLPVNILGLPNSELLKLALTSNYVKPEKITEEEKNENINLKRVNGFKKSRKEINEYLKNYLGLEFIQYNLVETYANNDEYLIIGKDYIYYSEITLPEKIYMAVDYKCNENKEYEVLIYEYDVTRKNKEKLNKMLKTGEIKYISSAKKYKLTGTIEDDGITVSTKVMLSEDLSNDNKITIQDVLEDINKTENLNKDTSNDNYEITLQEDGTISVKILKENINDEYVSPDK